MIAIINCCGNNTASIQYALERLNIKSILTTDPAEISSATHVILPGVGQAKYAMNQLEKNNLIDLIRNLTQPVLGICLGMQLLYEKSEEGETTCFGIIPGEIKRIPNKISHTTQIVPHMGWNTIKRSHTKPTNRTPDSPNPYLYFVHGFYAPVNQWTIAKTHYGIEFTSIVKYKNFVGMQFHPEKSGIIGQRLLSRFIKNDLKEKAIL